jgi:hypothetical protein
MPHGHSAIDSLIALTALRKYQEGGEVTPPTMGQRFVQRFPSQHEERASEQERGLANLIDLVMPQSVTEAGLMLAAGPILGKAGKAGKAVKRITQGEMIPKAKRYLIPDFGDVFVPGHVQTSKGYWAKHLRFPREVFKSDRNLEKTIRHFARNVSKDKQILKRYKKQGIPADDILQQSRNTTLTRNKQRLDALRDFKYTPEKDLGDRLNKWINKRPSGEGFGTKDYYRKVWDYNSVKGFGGW